VMGKSRNSTECIGRGDITEYRGDFYLVRCCSTATREKEAENKISASSEGGFSIIRTARVKNSARQNLPQKKSMDESARILGAASSIRAFRNRGSIR